MESSRSKFINRKLQESRVSSVHEQLSQGHSGAVEATSVSVERVPWIPGVLVRWRAFYDAFP